MLPVSVGVDPIDRCEPMSKRRAPLTIENVLLKVLGDLTPERCARTTEREASYLRDASDPDKAQQLTVRDMIKLDIEHLGYNGRAPFAEIYTDAVAIGDVLAEVLREDSDAHLALLRASRPDATDQDLIDAVRET